MNKVKPFPRVVTCQPNVRLFAPSPDSSKASFWQLLLSSIGAFSFVGCLGLCLSTFEALRALRTISPIPTIILTEVPSLQVILARQYGSEGRFTFTSHTPGEHQICLHSNSTKFSLFAGGMLVSGPMLDSFGL